MNFQFEPIGKVSSVFKEKFGIPRQPGLVPSARAVIRLPAARFRGAVDGLEEFSHIWVIFVFHEAKGSKLRVRPPRLGGSKRTGVFASRSPHRPNPIGMSVVKLEGIETSSKEILIHVSGADLLDGTPVLDIKPYIRYADSISRAKESWASPKKTVLRVFFSPLAREQCLKADPRDSRKLRLLIRQMISQDPRPSFQSTRNEDADYAFRIAEFDVHWSIRGGRAIVRELLHV